MCYGADRDLDKLKALHRIGNSALVNSILSFIAVAFHNIYYKRNTYPGLIC